MKKLNPNVRVTGLDSLAYMLLQDYAEEKGLSNDEFLKKQFEKLQNLMQGIRGAIKRDRAKSKIKEMDQVRDAAVRSLANIIDGCASFPMAKEKAAGLALQKIFDKYGREITTENYKNKGSFIESLLADFAKPEAQQNIQQLQGVAEALEALQKAQDDFRQGYTDFLADVVDKNAEPNAVDFRKPIVELVNRRLVHYLTALEEEPAYRHFAGMVALTIERVNRSVSSSRKKA